MTTPGHAGGGRSRDDGPTRGDLQPRFSTNRVLAIAAGVLGTLALIAGDTPTPGGAGAATALDLAAAIRADPDGVVVLDVRDEGSFAEFHAPRARRFDGAPEDTPSLLREIGVTAAGRVFVTGGPLADPRPAWLALRRAGFENAHYILDIATAWLDDIVSPVGSPDMSAAERETWDRHAELSRYFGGFPRIAARSDDADESTSARLRRAKRRGCAF